MLAASVLLAAAPAATGHLALAGWEGAAWIATVLIATLVGPLARRRLAVASLAGAGVVALDLGLWWIAADDRFDPTDPAIAFLRDTPTAFGFADGGWALTSSLLWWAAVVVLVVVWLRRWHAPLAGILVAGAGALVGVAWWFDQQRGSTAADVGFVLLAGLLVALAARFDHETDGGPVALSTAGLITGLAWAAALLEFADGRWWALLGAAVVLAAVFRATIGLVGRSRPG